MTATTTSRRAIVAGVATLPAIAILPAVASAVSEPDPIFAVIERPRQLYGEYCAACYGNLPDGDPRLDGLPADEALLVFLTTQPITVAGAVAALE